MKGQRSAIKTYHHPKWIDPPKAWFALLPKPQPEPSSYKIEMAAALSSSVARRINYEKFRKSRRQPILDYLPIKLDIENVSRCNFHCPKCQVSGWKNHRRAKDMTFDEFKNLIDNLDSLLEIKLQGMGEPLLGGEVFFKMIQYARRKHIWVRTSTNASLLHIRENYKRLIDSDPNEVQISVDGASQTTFESIRRGSDFSRVIENCKLINNYCNSQNLLKTRMWVCLQQENFNEFLDLIGLAEKTGFRRLTFAINLHGWGQKQYIDKNNDSLLDHEQIYETVQQAIEYGNKFNIKVSFWSNTNKYKLTSINTLCQWPFERAFISSDLRIVPCCMIANPHVMDIGNARQFTHEWNSKIMQKFRSNHLNGTVPLQCKSCYKHL